MLVHTILRIMEWEGKQERGGHVLAEIWTCAFVCVGSESCWLHALQDSGGNSAPLWGRWRANKTVDRREEERDKDYERKTSGEHRERGEEQIGRLDGSRTCAKCIRTGKCKQKLEVCVRSYFTKVPLKMSFSVDTYDRMSAVFKLSLLLLHRCVCVGVRDTTRSGESDILLKLMSKPRFLSLWFCPFLFLCPSHCFASKQTKTTKCCV